MKMLIENEAMELLVAELYWAKMMVEIEMVVPLEVRVMGSWLELELELSWAKMVVENEMELSLTGRVLGIWMNRLEIEQERYWVTMFGDDRAIPLAAGVMG